MGTLVMINTAVFLVLTPLCALREKIKRDKT